jgi:DNA-binding Lrp family transcriptional regulator
LNEKYIEGEIKVPLAFVLINTEMGSMEETLKALSKIDNVKEAYMVYGVYDIVAKVEAESMTKLKELVTWKIRKLDKVRSTLSMIVMNE